MKRWWSQPVDESREYYTIRLHFKKYLTIILAQVVWEELQSRQKLGPLSELARDDETSTTSRCAWKSLKAPPQQQKKKTKKKITEQEIDNQRNNQIEFLSLRNFVKYFFWGINNNNNCCVCVCGARRRPLAPNWWLVWVPPGVIVARPRAMASSSCCLLTIAGKEKVGGSSPNELLAVCGHIWKEGGVA